MATPPQDVPAQPAAPAPAPVNKRAKWWSETKPDVKWATALLLTLILISPIVGYWVGLVDVAPAGYGKWESPTAGEEDLTEVTQLIFSTEGLVVPFEILSILLLAALVAGIVLAFRDPPEGAE